MMQTVEIQELGLQEDRVAVEANLMTARRELELVEQIGLRHLAGQARNLVTLLEKRAGSPYQTVTVEPLTKRQLAIWHEWLPTSYRGLSLGAYRYDRVPVSVLEYWTQLKEAGLFEDYEIRTPERIQPDPALFGFRDGKVYLIARWGESEESLISFQEISDTIVSRLQRSLKWRLGPFAVFILASVTAPTYLAPTQDVLKAVLPFSIFATLIIGAMLWAEFVDDIYWRFMAIR